MAIDSLGNDVNEKNADGTEKVSSDALDLTDFSLYHPGSKVAIPLLKPNVHLTAPCWRDFARAVRKNERWNVKRIVATPVEKQKFKESRKSNVYFINLVFTVPARPKVECLDNVK